jgi:ubiquinol-cytochrome c reductase cytochrome b subunit
VSIIHLGFLHEFGSSNPLGLPVQLDNINFIPYYGIKDAFSFFFILLIFLIFIFSLPDTLGHSDNYIRANSLVTPAHIVPE